MDPQLAENTCKELLQQYGLQDWKFRWSSAEAQFGACWHDRKEIVLSKPLVQMNDAKHVLETILHEIAHALTGPQAEAHGSEWRKIAWSLGIVGTRCYGGEVATPKPRYALWCNCCSKVIAERRERSQAMKQGRWYCKLHGKDVVWVDRRAPGAPDV